MRARGTAPLSRGTALVGCALAALSCAIAPGQLRFHNELPHWHVDDRALGPQPRETTVLRYDIDYWFWRPVQHALDVPERTRALDVNSLGEVPDSTWFTNRIGIRDLTVDEVRRGPNGDEGPVPPLRVTLLRGDRRGMRVEDARGVAFFVELDPPERPELGSAADVISQRLLWAVGYNVPENSIIHFERSELVVDEDALAEHEGGTIWLTEDAIDGVLAGQELAPDGRYRALASKLLDGRPVGPYPQAGTRPDDPNDVIPHEHRRDLRGQYVFFGWLAHTDVNPSNRLDMWVEDPSRPGDGHIVHYLLDFDRSLGALSLTRDEPWDGHSYGFDYAYVAASMLALGLWQRPWEGFEAPDLRGVGRFDAAHFVPQRFKPRHYYGPFLHRDDFDCFWAAKIVMRLRPAHIRAAVEAAMLSDPRSTEYLVETLIARQRKIGRHWFTKVNPLDDWRVERSAGGDALCGADLLVQHDLDAGARANTGYTARAYDRDGRRVPWHERGHPDGDGGFCIGPLPPTDDGDGYTIVSIRTHRGERVHAPVLVHLARDPSTGRPRVIGVDRRR